jgi:hypothetical protein
MMLTKRELQGRLLDRNTELGHRLNALKSFDSQEARDLLATRAFVRRELERLNDQEQSR